MTSGSVSRRGMKSVTRTLPSSVSQIDSSTIVSSRYRRRVALPPASGAIRQRPASGPPNSAANDAAESNRGRHSQSIEPFVLTSAAVCRSASTA
jgi:hypothetical protein